MNNINIFCLWTGYLVYGLIIFYSFLHVYWHSWKYFTLWIAEFRAIHRSRITLTWKQIAMIPVRFVKGWFKDWDASDEMTITYKDIGRWTSPRHIWSIGEYEWFEKKETIDNVEKSL
jgi:hypothetical protein